MRARMKLKELIGGIWSKGYDKKRGSFYYYNEKTGEFLLLIGDEKGKVKIQDISVIPQTYNLKPEDLSKNLKRNPHFKIDKTDQDVGADNDDGQSDDGD